MSETSWNDYIPLAVMGFLSAILIIGVTDVNWLLTPIDLPTTTHRLSLLFFSLFYGICFFGMVQFGFFIWKGVSYLLDKLTVLYTEKRS